MSDKMIAILIYVGFAILGVLFFLFFNAGWDLAILKH